MNRLSAVILLLIVAGLLPLPARAEVKTIEAESGYVIGENDSKADSRRIAAQEARSKVLDLAGPSVENLISGKSRRFASDEAKACIAAVLETEIASEQMRGTTDRPEICIKARCRIDTDVLMARIDRCQENEDLQEQLAAFSREIGMCRREREALVGQLAAAKDRSKAEETRKKLDAVLSREESYADTISVCARLGNKLEGEDDNGHDIKLTDLDSSAVILERAVKVDPQNQRAHCLLALIYQKQGRQSAAENEFRTAIRNNTSSPAPHMRLGILLRELGRYREAEKEFHFVERVRPRNLPVVFYSGLTFKDMDKCGKAVQNLNRFLKDKRVDAYPRKKQTAIAAIEECGGDRPGRQKRIRTAVR
jgi:tetratricopeptide (TPR) repeat protein